MNWRVEMELIAKRCTKKEELSELSSKELYDEAIKQLDDGKKFVEYRIINRGYCKVEFLVTKEITGMYHSISNDTWWGKIKKDVFFPYGHETKINSWNGEKI